MGALDQYAGEAASGLRDLNTGANIYGGIRSGTAQGYAGAGLNAAKLAGKTGVFGSNTGAVNTGVGGALNALNIYNGIQQGGVSGYGNAAVNAAQLGSKLGAFGGASGAIGSMAGYAAIPLALYSEINNWQSGATGSDALAGASTGAAIGSVVPGIGTAIGALVGGAAGALSSVFGNGRVAPENANWVGYTGAQNQVIDQMKQAGATPEQIQQAEDSLASRVSNPYGALAGYFDLRDNQIKGNNPLYQQYGRMGEQKFTNDLVNQINDARSKGVIGANDSASDIYNKVVNPWENSWGKGTSTDANAGAMQGLITQMISQYEGGTAKNNWLGRSGDQAFANLASPTTGAIGQTTSANKADLDAIAAQHDQQRQSMGLAPAAAQAQNQTTAPQNITPQPVMASPNSRLGVGLLGSTIGNTVMGRKKGGAIAQRLRFDDGGDVSFDSGGGDDYQWTGFNPGNTIDFNSIMSGGSGNDTQDWNSNLSDIQGSIDANNLAINNDLYGLDQFDQQYGISPGGAGKQSGLSKLAGNFTGANGLKGLLQAYSPLVGVLGSALQSKNNNAKTALAPGMTTGAVGAMPVPHFNRTPIANPTNTGSPMTKQDWYTYGSRPEAQFFDNNQVPLVQSAAGQAKGGRTPPQGALSQAMQPPGSEFDSSQQSYVGDDPNMPGDGQSDEVPAKLSKGEFVMDGHTVSMLGNGSNSAGAAKLEKLRQNLRKHAAKSNSKGKQFMHAKEPEHYMNQGKPKKASAGAR